MKKGIICAIFLLLMTICIQILSSCSLQKVSPTEDFEYEFENGEVIITGYTGTDLDIVIPNTIEKRPVTTIGEEAFMHYDMNSIVLPETLKIIKKDAFRGCTMLSEINIPEGVTEVQGSYTFADCDSLSTIHLPDTIQRLDETFGGSPWYEEQPEGVLYIDNVCVGFKGENYPDSLEIKDGTTSIIRLFQGSISDLPTGHKEHGINFKEIYIPESVNYIAPESLGYYVRQYYYYGVKEETKQTPLFSIHGITESAAEKYATDNNMVFYSTNSKGKEISGIYVLTDMIGDDEFDPKLEVYQSSLSINGNQATYKMGGKDPMELNVDTDKQMMYGTEDNTISFPYELDGNQLTLDYYNRIKLIFTKQ